MTATVPTYEDFLVAMVLRAQQQTPELTDVQPGSVFRSLLSAIADQMEVVATGAAEAAEDSIRESAYRLWSFDRAPASAASGVVTLTANATISTAITIPAGTQVRVPGTDRVYRTLGAYTFPIGASNSTLAITVVSIGAGNAYNTAAGTIKEFVSSPSSLLSVSNALAFTNGTNEETDAERLQRFAAFVRSLHRATAESLSFAAEQATVVDSNGVVIERVTDAVCVDVSTGLARLYIANGSGSAASAGLLAAANTQAQAYKAAGITVQTLAATLTSVTVTMTVVLDSTVSLTMVKTTIQEAVTNLIAGLKIGETLYKNRIIDTVLSVPGVMDVSLSSPSSNTVPAVSAQVVLAAVPGVS